MLQHAQMSHAFQTTTPGNRTYQISKLSELERTVNVTVFRDVLELDDEDEEYFTRSLVCDFFTLAQKTFNEMDACLKAQDVKRLRNQAIFLRGPCATLGIFKVEASCTQIEQLTAIADNFQTESETTSTLCNSARTLLDQAQVNFEEAANLLRRFYGMA